MGDGRAMQRRVAFTRATYEVEHYRSPLDEDVEGLADFAAHMRAALARICDKGITLKEAQRIAKLARMGEEWTDGK